MSDLFEKITQQMFKNRSYIIWWPVVEVFETYDADIRKIFATNQAKRYPDGSVSIEGVETIGEFFLKMHGYSQSGLMLRENTFYRALACFPRRSYQILTTWAYFNRIGGEGDFAVFPTDAMSEISPNERESANLHCRVYFWRRPTAAIVETFVQKLLEWEKSVERGGIFGDGPARFKTESLKKDHAKQYSFRLDFSRSGQETLNWLVLSLLNFGEKYFPISEVWFGKP